ncbi:MAG: heavy-metal-associated domain-containing protein [Rudanella sp.]|nr:heavy-metal-associated domain-containing protein [Rudanella sp.]
METLKFKTNIKCGGCVATVTPSLNAVEGVESWAVDTADPNKVLTVQAQTATAADVRKAVEAAGYKAESLN